MDNPFDKAENITKKSLDDTGNPEWHIGHLLENLELGQDVLQHQCPVCSGLTFKIYSTSWDTWAICSNCNNARIVHSG